MKRSFPLLCAVALALAAAARTAPADVVVHTLRGDAPLRGISLVADASKLALHAAEGPARKVPTAEVVEVATVPRPATPPASARPFEVELIDGSRLRGILDAGSEGELRLRSPVLRDTVGPLAIPLDWVMAVRRVDGRKIPGSSRLVRVPDKDAAYSLSGARVEGFVSAFHATGIEVDRGDLGPRRIPFDDLAALFVDNSPLARPDGLHVIARLADGSVAVLGKGFRISGGMLSGKLPCGVALRAGVARVAALSFQGGSFVHLTDLPPARIEREPFFPLVDGPAREAMLDFVCPVRFDKSPDGGTITLQKRSYFRGIGVRPRTAITYDLSGAYREFFALCGIDDEVLGPGYGRGAGTGSVVFEVLVDGKRVLQTAPVHGGQEPVKVRLPVAGRKQLTLVVALVPEDKMPGRRPDSPELDNAVWARPLLIR